MSVIAVGAPQIEPREFFTGLANDIVCHPAIKNGEDKKDKNKTVMSRLDEVVRDYRTDSMNTSYPLIQKTKDTLKSLSYLPGQSSGLAAERYRLTEDAERAFVYAIALAARTSPSLPPADRIKNLGSFEFRAGRLYYEAVSKLEWSTDKEAARDALNIVLRRLGVVELNDKEIDSKKIFLDSMHRAEEKLASGYPEAADKFAAFLQEVKGHLPYAHPLKAYTGQNQDSVEELQRQLSAIYADNECSIREESGPTVTPKEFEKIWKGYHGRVVGTFTAYVVNRLIDKELIPKNTKLSGLGL